MAAQSETISLNLILDYPVKWSKYKVLRDFIQNFYDAVGYQNWHRDFNYQIKGQTLQLTAQNIGFSYDWLIHIGASTKRENEGAFAGYFGEGFKIASLCAFRDHKWRVSMASRNWELTVTTVQVEVDNQQLTTLAYDMRYYPISRENTVLVLDYFSADDEKILQAALLSFYYRENPLLGEKIWESSRIAIFYRSKFHLPAHFPTTYNEKGKGIVFAAYQAMGTFNYGTTTCLSIRNWKPSRS